MSKRSVSSQAAELSLAHLAIVGIDSKRSAMSRRQDEASAIAKAIEEYQVREPWRQRWLAAKRYA